MLGFGGDDYVLNLLEGWRERLGRHGEGKSSSRVAP
eukprot:COSAG06_NODE_7849_length_2353_cov_3.108696_2_plen_36_part_00